MFTAVLLCGHIIMIILFGFLNINSFAVWFVALCVFAMVLVVAIVIVLLSLAFG